MTTSLCDRVRTSIGSWKARLPVNLRRQRLRQTRPATTSTAIPPAGNSHPSIEATAVGSLGCALTRLGQDEREQPRALAWPSLSCQKRSAPEGAVREKLAGSKGA